MPTNKTRLPLHGVRVIAIEQYGAAPYGSLFLAQMGAEVIKIEHPQAGDISRRVGPYLLGENDSQFFQTFNANKKSVTLDIKTREGRVILEKLVGTADALIHNLRGDRPKKLKLAYRDFRKINPRIVCGHLTAYGREGVRSSWPGYDYLMQAEAGFLSLTGEPGGMPARFGLSVVDYMTGIMLAYAVAAGIIKAQRTDIGCDVDASLFDTAIHQLSYLATWYLNEGHVTGTSARSAHPSITPSQLIRTKDGWVFVMCQTQKFWDALTCKIKAPKLGRDRRFATMVDRLKHRTALTKELDAIFKTRRTVAWLKLLNGDVPVSAVNNLAQALDNSYVREIGMISQMNHGSRPGLKVLANPIRVDGKRTPIMAAPQLGAHNREILAEIGFSGRQVQELRSRNII